MDVVCNLGVLFDFNYVNSVIKTYFPNLQDLYRI